MDSLDRATIAAQATPVGSGGVGIVRISGSLASEIMEKMLHRTLPHRYAYYGDFYDADGGLLDRGIAIYFAAPNSFTGEDVLELQGHGGQVVMQCLLDRVLSLGARLAAPGEFSYRAFCNHKMDLTQAEAIADLIAASSELAAKQAVRSLQGDFAKLIYEVSDRLVEIRASLEYMLDFTEDELLLNEERSSYQLRMIDALSAVSEQLAAIFSVAKLGLKIQEGMRIAIVGRPNAGKSTLFNCLCGCQRAIVTDIPGTTRDLLRATVQLGGGLQVELVDTAGFRDNPDQIEAIGINLAYQELQTADHIVYVIDACDVQPDDGLPFVAQLPAKTMVTIVYNKIDLLTEQKLVGPRQLAPLVWEIKASLKSGDGVEQLVEHLCRQLTPHNLVDTGFSARERHIDCLTNATKSVEQALQGLKQEDIDWAVIAEEVRSAHVALSDITGQNSTEELLNRVFSSFCVGK